MPDGSHADGISFVRDRPGHDRRYAIDPHKIESELGWRARESFETGLRKTVRWYLEHSDWVQRVRSGEYRNWIERQYGRSRPTRFTEVLARTTRLLGATRRHYAEHGLASTVAKVGSWLHRRMLRPCRACRRRMTRATSRAIVGQRRHASPPNGRPPRVAYVRIVAQSAAGRATRFENAADLYCALREEPGRCRDLADAPWSDEIADVLREAFALSVPTAYIGAPGSLQLVPSVPPHRRATRQLFDPQSSHRCAA